MGELGWQVQTQPNCNSVLLPLISALSSSHSLISRLFLENPKHTLTRDLGTCWFSACSAPPMRQVGCSSCLPTRQ